MRVQDPPTLRERRALVLLQLRLEAEHRSQPKLPWRDQPLRLGGNVHPHGTGTRSISELVIDLRGTATPFTPMVGFDAAVRAGVRTVTFAVWADDELIAASGLMRSGDAERGMTTLPS